VLQVAYAALILSLSVGAIFVLYREIVSGMTAAINLALTTTTSIDASVVLADLEAARTREIVSVAFLVLIATAVFGYLVARLALSPTRNALAAQKEFIGNVAHELRTPLAIIKANTEILILEEKGDRSLRSTLTSNIEELDRISDIINNLLTLNVLVQPEQVSFALVDLEPVVRRVVDKLSPSAQKKAVRMKVKLSVQCCVWGNATALEQIITNILKNAIQHTNEGEIVITGGLDGYGSLQLEIRDTGMGIKQKDLFRIFEPFYRGDRARTRGGGVGSGLGLAIVSELVKLHRGRVSVRSAPGRGTTVTVTLPLGLGPAKGHQPSTSDELSEVFADYSNNKG
jgi:signal transduction histidine kinase